MRTNVRPSGPFARWLLPAALTLTACGHAKAKASGWAGTVDTTASGTVVVHNPKTGIWDSSTAWRVVEEHRIGTAEGTGPDLFGRITTLAVDRAGRVYVFDGQAQELRIFDSTGAYVRTIGRRGGGPGEFAQVIGMAWDPQGRLWVVDPQNNRVSIIDTAGEFVGEHFAIGGFIISPWPGNVDTAGHYFAYIPDPSADGFGIKLVEYDTAMTPLDTIAIPKSASKPEFFEATNGTSRMRTSVPFAAGFIWQLTRNGDFWFAESGQYHLFHRTLAGDTLREIERDFDPIPVTSADVDRAVVGLQWFTRQGGKIDRGKIPSVKPALQNFFLDDRGDVWVQPTVADSADNGRLFDIFDPTGRYLGRLNMPFSLSGYPRPVVRADRLYGVTTSDLGVPFVVIARIERP